jgi:hypothetical protein
MIEDEKTLIREFINGGWLVTLLGSLAMTARLFASANKHTIIDQVKKIIAAALSSTIAWFILEQTDISSIYKAMSYGIIGVISPEVIGGLVKLGKYFEKKPTEAIDQIKKIL